LYLYIAYLIVSDFWRLPLIEFVLLYFSI